MKEGHLPVLAEEVMAMLSPAPGSLQIDATVGGGGHTERILEATTPDGRLLGLDADGAAIARVDARLRPRFGDRLVLRQANFRELKDVAPDAGFGAVDGLLFDLGLSSYQLADPERGFGFRTGGPLDMRFDTSRGVPAAELLATLDADELTALFRRYGEEPLRAADRPGDRRPRGRPRRSTTAEELAALVERVVARQPPRPAPDPPRDPRLPGAPDRRQRRARRTPGRARRRGRPAAAGRPARRPELPLARGPDRQALHRRRAPGLHLPARAAGLRLRPIAASAPRDPAVADPDGRRDRRQPPRAERPPAGRRAPRRLTTSGRAHGRHGKEEASVSKRHQSSRRRSYGRRQHELHERQIRRRHFPEASDLGFDGSRRRSAGRIRSPSWTRARRACASCSATSGWRSTQGARPQSPLFPGRVSRSRRAVAASPGAGSAAPSAPGAARTACRSCSAGSSSRSSSRSSRWPRRCASRRPATTSNG